MSAPPSVEKEKAMAEIPKYIGSARRFKARKRRELAALEQAVNVLRVGCAFTPFHLDFDNVARAVKEWRKACSVEEWGR